MARIDVPAFLHSTTITCAHPFELRCQAMSVSLVPAASVDVRLDIPEGLCEITHRPLDVSEIIRSVGDDTAGGTAVFIGTTRNSFKGSTNPL